MDVRLSCIRYLHLRTGGAWSESVFPSISVTSLALLALLLSNAYYYLTCIAKSGAIDNVVDMQWTQRCTCRHIGTAALPFVRYGRVLGEMGVVGGRGHG